MLTGWKTIYVNIVTPANSAVIQEIKKGFGIVIIWIKGRLNWNFVYLL